MYIFWSLHQTTTIVFCGIIFLSCISFDPYIKPQQCRWILLHSFVVYLLIPTSNHNVISIIQSFKMLYIFWSLHQTTTMLIVAPIGYSLYIFWSLHQTTTCNLQIASLLSCISFDPYIKPQPLCHLALHTLSCISFDPYIKPQLAVVLRWILSVVYLLIPTSNHNCNHTSNMDNKLYIFWSLHQTTTLWENEIEPVSCISFDPYIKPQLQWCFLFWSKGCISFDPYIKPQRAWGATYHALRCISFDPYIKPQRILYSPVTAVGCISFDPYIKPQQWSGTSKIRWSCISFDPYIKPQPLQTQAIRLNVVYLLIPTSNHNYHIKLWFSGLLYIFWSLHQTTT